MKGQTALNKYERIYKSQAETITEDIGTHFQIKAPCPHGCFLPDFFYSPTMNWLILSPSKIPLPPTALYLGGIRRSMPYWNRCLRSWRKTGIHRRMISRTNRRIRRQRISSNICVQMKYMVTTIATGVSTETAAAIMENKDVLTGGTLRRIRSENIRIQKFFLQLSDIRDRFRRRSTAS